MKANEAPEKIYLYENLFGRAADYWLREKSSDTDIEYTRTDAFIEKACEWLKTNFNMPDDFENHFKKAMKL